MSTEVQGTGKKATKQQMAIRVKAVRELLVDGYSRAEILEYVRNNFSASRASADIYIQRAYLQLRKEVAPNANNHIAKIYSRYDRLYRKALENGDYANARQALDSICKLLGLNKPERHEVIKRQAEPETEEQILARINAILNSDSNTREIQLANPRAAEGA